MSQQDLQTMDDRPPLRTELRILLTLSVPTVVITASRTLVSFTDMAMVSRLGTEAAAALMPANLALFCIIAFGTGCSTAVNTFASQSLGRGKPEDGARFAFQGLLLSAALGLMALPLIALVPHIVATFGHAVEVARMEQEYAAIGLLGVGMSVGAVAISYYFIGMHQPRIAMYGSILEVLANLLGNYAFIYGHFGFPAMGIAGCAWSTVFSSALRLATLLAWYWSGPHRKEFKTGAALQVEFAKIRSLLRVGYPTGFTFSMEIVAWTVFINYIVGKFGTNHLAANNFVFQYLHVSFMPAVGIGMSLAALVGRAVGQRDPQLVIRRTRLGTLACVLWMGACGLCFLIFRDPLMRLWTDDPEVIALGKNLMICAAVFQIFDGLGIATSSALRGTGDTLWPGVANVVLSYLVLVGGSLVVATWVPQWSSVGPWMMASLFIILLSVILRVRFVRGAWRKIDIFSQEASPACAGAEDDASRSSATAT